MNSDDHKEPDSLVLVGEITAPFGVRGELKMRPLLSRVEELPKISGGVHLRYPGGREETRRMTGARQHQEVALVTFERVPDRDAADLLRNVQVLVRREELPPLPEGEYYEQDLLGLQVVTDAGRDLGAIEQVHYYPANDVYETAEAMIPAVEEFVVEVNLAERRLVVRDVPGLRKDE